MTAVTESHIWLDERGVAWVDNTNTKVREVALDVIAHGWSPQEIHENHDYLSLAQIHAALTYYYDHKDKIDAEIEEGEKLYRELRAASGNNGITRAKLEQRLKR